MNPLRLIPVVGLSLMLPLSTVAQSVAQPERGPEGSVTPVTSSAQKKIDLNTASIPELESVPEIGTDHANAVVAGRPYKSVEDAARVLKFSPEKMATLRPRVMVSPPPATASTPSERQTTGPSKPAHANEGKATAASEVNNRYETSGTKSPAKSAK